MLGRKDVFSLSYGPVPGQDPGTVVALWHQKTSVRGLGWRIRVVGLGIIRSM